jgi:protease I
MRKMVMVLAAAVCIMHVFSFAGYAQEAKKAVMIIANTNFQDNEFAQPKKVLEENGIKVTVASTSLNEAVGMNGTKAMPDILINNIMVKDFDAVIFVGGSGATEYLDDPAAKKIAQEAVSANKVVGAICIAPVCLAKAGVLKGKRATTYPAEANQKQLALCGATYTAQPVEKDGNIITADGPRSAKAFGEEIIKALKL